MKLEAVYIKWVDTVGDPENGWKDAEQTNEFFGRDDNVVEEVGFVWYEDDDYVNLCGGWMPGEAPLTKHRTKIPKKWVILRKNLEL
jgi:hypothetical protein